MDIPTVSNTSSYSRLVQDYRLKEQNLKTEPNKAQETDQSQDQAVLEREKQKIISDLSQRDTEVRAHEEAHANVGGQYASAPQYDLTEGPDGKQYATGGHVDIDISKEEEPEDTVVKMDIVERAALAPAQPSPQDFKVAGEARVTGNEAQIEVQVNRAEELKKSQESEETGAAAEGSDESTADNDSNVVDINSASSTQDNNESLAAASQNKPKQFSFGLSFPQQFISSTSNQPDSSQANQLLQRFDSLGLTYPTEPLGQQVSISA